MGINEKDYGFLTKEEKGLFSLTQTEVKYEESEDYKQGFQNTIMELHRQYNLRSKKNSNKSKKNNTKNPTKKVSETVPKKTT